MGISLKPSEAVEGGGLIDDVDVRLTNPRFELWDYNGAVKKPVPALAIDLVPIDGDDEGDPVPQYWSMGSPKDFVPSKDGSKLNPIGNRTAPNSSSNGMLFLGSLVNSGFPEDDIEDDIGFLDGMVAHVRREPAPKRSGMAPREDGREPTFLAVTDIVHLPGEEPKGKAKGKASKSAGKAKAAGSKASKGKAKGKGGSVKETTTEMIVDILKKNEGEVTKQQLPSLLFEEAKDHGNVSEIVQIAFDDKFLADGPWDFEDGVLTLEDEE